MIKWFEIPAFDIQRAVKFYSTVFRVEFDMEVFNEIPHAIFKKTGKAVSPGGAIVQSKEFSASLNQVGAVLFFQTSDMSVTLEKIEDNNGVVIIPKTLIKNISNEGKVTIPKTLIDGNTGYFAYFTDSEGNKMGLYSNS